MDVARGALVASGGIRGLLDLDREELCRLPGFGPARYVELQACLEIGRRHLATQLDRGEPLTTPDATSRFLMAKLRHLPFEVFSCLFLDNRHRVIEFEEMSAAPSTARPCTRARWSAVPSTSTRRR